MTFSVVEKAWAVLCRARLVHNTNSEHKVRLSSEIDSLNKGVTSIVEAMATLASFNTEESGAVRDVAACKLDVVYAMLNVERAKLDNKATKLACDRTSLFLASLEVLCAAHTAWLDTLLTVYGNVKVTWLKSEKYSNELWDCEVEGAGVFKFSCCE